MLNLCLHLCVQFVNLSVIPWSSVECVTTLSVYDKLVLIALVPPVAVVFVAVIPLIILTIQNRYDVSDATKTRRARSLARRKIIKLVVFALFLLYPGISSRVLSYFICRRVNDVNYLVADFTEVCKCFWPLPA